MRLIDADALINELVNSCNNDQTKMFPVWIEKQIDAQPTVVMLKEQEAKQIVRKQVKKYYEDGSIDYFAEWYCPHCNSLILRGFDNPSIKFCYKCGKPVLWRGQ